MLVACRSPRLQCNRLDSLAKLVLCTWEQIAKGVADVAMLQDLTRVGPPWSRTRRQFELYSSRCRRVAECKTLSASSLDINSLTYGTVCAVHTRGRPSMIRGPSHVGRPSYIYNVIRESQDRTLSGLPAVVPPERPIQGIITCRTHKFHYITSFVTDSLFTGLRPRVSPDYRQSSMHQGSDRQRHRRPGPS